jgi:hypothetical protein
MINIVERIKAKRMVNHAPSGTLTRDDEMYAPSRAAKTKKKNITIGVGIRQEMMATKETMQVVMKVTTMTQTPYAFPRDVVWKKSQFLSTTRRVGGSGTNIIVNCCDNDSSNHEQPVCKWHVDLLMKF